MWWFVLGFISAALLDLIRFLWRKLGPRLTYWRLERAALPDGTRVHLRGYGFSYEAVWTTEWSMRRDPDGPDDYRLKREGGTETTYARRDALDVVEP